MDMQQLVSSLMNSQNIKSLTANTGTTSDNTGTVNNKDVSSLLSKQLATNANLNKLLDSTMELVTCPPGSQCSKDQISEDLKRKYLDAQINEQVAPLRLEKAKKYYYVFKEGRNYYNEMLETEMTKKSEAIVKQIAEKFNEEIQNANIMNSYYNTIQINSENSVELYDEYLKKNKEMLALIKGTHGDVLTNDRKTYYETEAIDKVKLWNTFLVIIYWILFATLVLSMVFSPSTMSIKQKMLLGLALILYPFFINKVVMFFYDYYTNTFVKNIDTNVYMSL
jgi:hypothetical protein